MVRSKPSKKEEIYDAFTENKQPEVVEMFGKPNVYVSMTGVAGEAFKMNQIGNFTPEEFIKANEQLQEDPNSGAAYRKIFE